MVNSGSGGVRSCAASKSYRIEVDCRPGVDPLHVDHYVAARRHTHLRLLDEIVNGDRWYNGARRIPGCSSIGCITSGGRFAPSSPRTTRRVPAASASCRSPAWASVRTAQSGRITVRY